MDRSAARRIAPAGFFPHAVLDDRRHRWVPIRDREHLALVTFVGLRVVLGERNAARIVVVPCGLTIRTIRLYVHNNAHCSKLHLFCSIIYSPPAYVPHGPERCTPPIRPPRRDRDPRRETDGS